MSHSLHMKKLIVSQPEYLTQKQLVKGPDGKPVSVTVVGFNGISALEDEKQEKKKEVISLTNDLRG